MTRINPAGRRHVDISPRYDYNDELRACNGRASHWRITHLCVNAHRRVWRMNMTALPAPHDMLHSLLRVTLNDKLLACETTHFLPRRALAATHLL